MTTSGDRIEELKKQIADLKDRWPAHSVPPSMVQELDDLEEQLEEALQEEKRRKSADSSTASSRLDESELS
jgi:hypothetical protein